MLASLEGKASWRKIILFYCAAWNRLRPLLSAQESQHLSDQYQNAETVSGPAERGILLFSQLPLWFGRSELLKSFNGEGERWVQAKLLRDIFGPLPFRSIAVDPAWRVWNDGTVVRIARASYDEQAFDRLPILADALEEAGCDDADILAHCRQHGPHIRGCWVVDLILGLS
jgi:hypothetical protein